MNAPSILPFVRRDPEPARDSDPSPRLIASNASGNNNTRRFTDSEGNTLVAAATVLNLPKIRRMRGKQAITAEKWQADAWHFFDITPELSYVARFESAAMSRAALAAARVPDSPDSQPELLSAPGNDDRPGDESAEPADSADEVIAHQAINDFFGGRANQSQALTRMDNQLTVAGVTHIVMWKDPDSNHHRWDVLSEAEIHDSGGRWRIESEGEDVVVDKDDALVIRAWNPHPRNFWHPTSPVRHLLPVLAELEGLTKHVSAAIDSRLAGAGILGIPSELDFPVTEEAPDGVDQFTWELFLAMTKPLTDRDNASALVPLVIRGSAEALEAITRITFETAFDPQIKNLREEAIRRIALGLDVPPEILLGMAEANHWTSWQIEESSIKLHIEPKLQMICHAITTGYLHPYLRSRGVDEPERFMTWYDVTQIKLRPNRSADAKDLHDDLLISDSARIHAAGFDENDRPSKEEFRDMLLRKVITDAPQLGLNLLPLVGIDPVIYGTEDNPRTSSPENPVEVNNNPTNEADDTTPSSEVDSPNIDTDNIQDGTDGR